MRSMSPQYVPGWELLAAIQQKHGRVEEAANTCRAALSINPSAPRMHYALGQLMRQQGRFKDAAVAYEVAMEQGYANPDLYSNLAEVWFDYGDTEKAIDSLKTGICRHPDHSRLHELYAKMHWELQRSGDPVEHLRQRTREHENNTDLWVALVSMLDRLGRQDEARYELGKAQRSNCAKTPELELLSVKALSRAGKLPEAGRMLEMMDRLYPLHLGVLHAHAEHRLIVGHPERADRICEKILQVDAFNQLGWAYRGFAWKLLGDPREEWLNNYDKMIRQVELPPSGGYECINVFCKDLLRTLENLHRTKAQPIDQTLKGGTQTTGFLFRCDEPLIKMLEQLILDAVADIVRSFPFDEEHPFWGRRSRDSGVTR